MFVLLLLVFYPTSMSVYQLTNCYVPDDFIIYQRHCGELQIYNTFINKNIEVGRGTLRKSSSAIAYVSGFPLACKTWVAPNISVLNFGFSPCILQSLLLAD